LSVARILAIDDDPLVRATLRDLLALEGHEVSVTADGEQALELVARESFDLILCDLSLPGIAGAQLLEQLRERAPITPIVALTGYASVEGAVAAMKAGANDYATKPVRPADLSRRVDEAVRRSRRHLVRHQREMKMLFLKSIRSLVMSLEAKDPYTKNHSLKVAEITDRVAVAMGYSGETRQRIRLAAILHDVGKIGISETVLHKGGPLTREEFGHIMEHPLIGERILQPIMDGYSDVVAAVKHEHERFDGRGYPCGLRGEEIPFASRVIMVADCFDAITSKRPYRDAQAAERAFEVVTRGAGSQFDPAVAEVFDSMRSTWMTTVAAEPGPAAASLEIC